MIAQELSGGPRLRLDPSYTSSSVKMSGNCQKNHERSNRQDAAESLRRDAQRNRDSNDFYHR